MLKDQLIAFALLLPFLMGPGADVKKAPVKAGTTSVAMDPPLAGKADDKKPPVVATPKKEDSKAPVVAAPKKEEVKIPAKETPKKEEVKVPAKELPKKEEAKPPVVTTPKKEEVKVPVKETPKKEEVKLPVKEETKPPVKEAPKKEETKAPVKETPKKEAPQVPVKGEPTPGQGKGPVPLVVKPPYEEVTMGTGLKLAAGERAIFHFSVADAQGKELVNSKKRGLPFTVEVKADGTEMWDVMLRDMKVGGIRKMALAADQVNAGKGLPPYVPPGVAVTVTLWLLKSER